MYSQIKLEQIDQQHNSLQVFLLSFIKKLQCFD